MRMEEHCPVPSREIEEAYLRGAYEMCGLLLTSPRMNKAQVEVIEEQAYKVKDRLEALGATFTDQEASHA